MHFQTLTRALEHLSDLSHLQIYLTILASGHPLPVPEGVIFLALGLLAGYNPGTLLGYILIASAAALTYDLVLYGLAYTGTNIAASLSKRVKQSWTDRYDGASAFNTFLLIFASHFVPGWRMVNPVIAAGLKISPKPFILYSLVSAALYPTLYVLIGFVLLRN